MKLSIILFPAMLFSSPFGVTSANDTPPPDTYDTEVACLFCCNNSCNGSSVVAQLELPFEREKDVARNTDQREMACFIPNDKGECGDKPIA